MTLGVKASLGMFILLTAVFVCYSVLLNAGASGAQDTTMGTSMEPTGRGECTDAEEVATFSGGPGEDITTELFGISGEQFRVSFDSEGTGFAIVNITINDEDGDFVDSFFTGGEDQQDSLIVNEGPGNFLLDISADTEDRYTVTVENCGDSNQGGGGTTEPEETIIKIPPKNLPPTGGEVLLPAAALLLGSGTMAFYVLRRRH